MVRKNLFAALRSADRPYAKYCTHGKEILVLQVLRGRVWVEIRHLWKGDSEKKWIEPEELRSFLINSATDDWMKEYGTAPIRLRD